jgi:hypothetical protein
MPISAGTGWRVADPAPRPRRSGSPTCSPTGCAISRCCGPPIRPSPPPCRPTGTPAWPPCRLPRPASSTAIHPRQRRAPALTGCGDEVRHSPRAALVPALDASAGHGRAAPRRTSPTLPNLWRSLADTRRHRVGREPRRRQQAATPFLAQDPTPSRPLGPPRPSARGRHPRSGPLHLAGRRVPALPGRGGHLRGGHGGQPGRAPHRGVHPHRVARPDRTPDRSGSRPYLLFGLLAGALADRGDRRRLMVGGDLLRAALVGSVPLAAALGVLKLPHVYLAALGVAVVFVWADAASFGALPALIGRQRLPAANSARWSASTTLTITGPAVAGVLVATVGPTPALWVDAASYLASALLLASIRRSFQHRQEGDTPARPGPGPPGHRGGPPLPVAPPAGPAAHPGRVRQQPHRWGGHRAAGRVRRPGPRPEPPGRPPGAALHRRHRRVAASATLGWASPALRRSALPAPSS